MAKTGTDIDLGVGGPKTADLGPQRVYKEKGQRESEAEGYGKGQSPYFLSAFIVFLKRDRRTGGVEKVSIQCANLNTALRKAQEEMGVERVTTMYEAIAACREIVTQNERVLLADEVSEQVLRALQAQDRRAEVAIQEFVEKSRVSRAREGSSDAPD